MSLHESDVEAAALDWFGELGYAVAHGPMLAPGEPRAERQSFGEVVLVGRLSEAIRRLNPAIPDEARTQVHEMRIEGDDKLYAEGAAKVVWMNTQNGKSVPVPDHIRAALEAE